MARGDRIGRSVIPWTDYHGAHKATVDVAPVQRWLGDRCVAFVHDILSSQVLPAEYATCSVMVTDLPWQRGFDTFNQRAHIGDGRTYEQFMRSVAAFADTTDVPLWLVTGRHALKHLPAPGVVLSVRLNEDDAVAIGYRPGSEQEGRYGVTQEFLHALAQQYTVAGDFCAGYGRTGRFFLRAGGSAVLSDFNPQCIGYIAEHAGSWAET